MASSASKATKTLHPVGQHRHDAAIRDSTGARAAMASRLHRWPACAYRRNLRGTSPTPEDEQEEDIAGPIAIELAPLPVSPPAEKLDLPVGPRAEETQASTATPMKAETAKEEEAPNLTSTPYEPDDPDLRFSKQVLKKEAEETPTTTRRRRRSKRSKRQQRPLYRRRRHPHRQCTTSSGRRCTASRPRQEPADRA